MATLGHLILLAGIATVSLAQNNSTTPSVSVRNFPDFIQDLEILNFGSMPQDPTPTLPIAVDLSELVKSRNFSRFDYSPGLSANLPNNYVEFTNFDDIGYATMLFDDSCLLPLVARDPSSSPTVFRVTNLAGKLTFSVDGDMYGDIQGLQSLSAFYIEYPSFSTVNARARGLFTQTFNLAAKNFKKIVVYCPLVAVRANGWKFTIDASRSTTTSKTGLIIGLVVGLGVPALVILIIFLCCFRKAVRVQCCGWCNWFCGSCFKRKQPDSTQGSGARPAEVATQPTEEELAVMRELAANPLKVTSTQRITVTPAPLQTQGIPILPESAVEGQYPSLLSKS